MSKILRIFPRKTNATPMDEMVRIGTGPELFDLDEIDEIHISVTFTWDAPFGNYLFREWSGFYPKKTVLIGGPAYPDQKEGEFIPGRYLKPGYVITSRGCPNRCWFCDVWKKPGGDHISELEVKDGYNILDSNLLACSEVHIRRVFHMLREQRQPAQFTGGFEAARLERWHIGELLDTRFTNVFFAYDTPNDYEPLRDAARELFEAEIIGKGKKHKIKCYVLVGYPRDTFEKAEARLISVIKLGIMPMAMLYRDLMGKVTEDWRGFQREWASPIIVGYKMKRYAV